MKISDFRGKENEREILESNISDKKDAKGWAWFFSLAGAAAFSLGVVNSLLGSSANMATYLWAIGGGLAVSAISMGAISALETSIEKATKRLEELSLFQETDDEEPTRELEKTIESPQITRSKADDFSLYVTGIYQRVNEIVNKIHTIKDPALKKEYSATVKDLLEQVAERSRQLENHSKNGEPVLFIDSEAKFKADIERAIEKLEKALTSTGISNERYVAKEQALEALSALSEESPVATQGTSGMRR